VGWDTGFMAVGLAHLDTDCAARELRILFAYQWKNGKAPHIVFNPEAPPESYFPGAEHWICAGEFPDAPPAPPYISALRVWEVAGEKEISARDFLREIYRGCSAGTATS